MTACRHWAYKFDEAARRGAFGALVIHETEAAGYDWSVAAAGAGERVALAGQPADTPAITVQGWLHNDAAAGLLTMAGRNLDDLRTAARNPDFRAFELPSVHFNADLTIDLSHFDSRNVLGLLPGADLVDGGREAGNQWIADYVGNCYHKTCDAWSPDWDLTGAVQDIELIRRIIENLGNSTRWPRWREGSEFKAVREASATARAGE